MASHTNEPETPLSNGTTNGTDGPERRRSPRIRALYHVVISADGGRDEISVTVGRTIDVSETGVRLETPGHLCIDDKVRLEIAVEETVVNATGRVVHAARRGDLIEAGIEFLVIGEEDRLALATQA
jgi:hypothetical protein